MWFNRPILNCFFAEQELCGFKCLNNANWVVPRGPFFQDGTRCSVDNRNELKKCVQGNCVVSEDSPSPTSHCLIIPFSVMSFFLPLCQCLPASKLRHITYRCPWKWCTQARDTSKFRLYKRMQPLSYAPVFYRRLTIWTAKSNLPLRRLFTIMHKSISTYPISIWPTTSWIFSKTILCQLQTTGFISAIWVSTLTRKSSLIWTWWCVILFL